MLELCLSACAELLLTASTVTYDQAEHTVPYAYEPGLIARLHVLGLASYLEAAHAYVVRLLHI